jgi:hypothetical protein
MRRLAAMIILSSAAFAQTGQEPDISLAVKSPLTLARYVETHSTVDWKILRSGLNIKDSQGWFAPCGGNAPANEAQCSAETVTVTHPDQAIVIIRGGKFSFTDEYLRYLRDPSGNWKFAGENSAFKRFGPSNHALIRLGTKPFFKISSNHSQNGVAIQQEIEDWFDLTLSDFEPVFSFTSEGGAGGFAFTIARIMKAQSNFTQAAGLERIDTTLSVRFEGTPGLDFQSIYVGVYERHANEKKFTLRSAYLGMDRHMKIPTKDFQDLADPFANRTNETFMVYALPGLKKIAAGTNSDDRAWLRDFLDHSLETPEKHALTELLAKSSGRR